jgi:DNA modification methylase
LNKITIYQGHVLDRLKQLPSESVQMCVTSPPYFGLRNYGTEDIVWGGDKDCQHKWGNVGPQHHPGQVPDNKAVHKENAIGQTKGSGQFCTICGAWKGSLGLEPTIELYIEHLVEIFREVKRILRKDSTFWLNISDSYAGSGKAGSNPEYQKRHTQFGQKERKERLGQPMAVPEGLKAKDLMGIPWKLAFALQNDGWWLRQDIIWAKGVSFCPEYSGSVMPESVLDRCTRSHEYIFLLSKSQKYFYDNEAVKEKAQSGQPAGNKNIMNKGRLGKEGWSLNPENSTPSFRNLRSVWTINPKPFPEAHFACYPPELIEPIIKAGTSEKGCCSRCGSPWKRIVEKKIGYSKNCPKTVLSHKNRGGIGIPTGTVGKSGGSRIDGKSKTIDWQPTCNCNADTTPCTVLDPFFGSGTTGLVSCKLGRNCIGIELNPEYVNMAERRIKSLFGLMTEIEFIKE